MATEQTTTEVRTVRAGGSRLTVPRSRGALSGAALILLGIWGAIVPFVGPYFDFAFTPDSAWTWTGARGWLDVLPGCVAIVAGLVILLSAHRVAAGVAAWFGVAAGGWFIVGPQLAAFAGIGAIGVPTQTGTGMVALEWLAYFYALGGVIVFFSAAALGRISVLGAAPAARIAERRDDRVEHADAPAIAAPATAAPATAAPSSPAPPAAARDSARSAIERERSGRAHRRFLHRHDDRVAADEPISAADDRTPR